MSEQRDELALELFIADNHKQPRGQSILDWQWLISTNRFAVHTENYKTMADGLLAAGYSKTRTITTAEELDALPVGTRLAGNLYIFQRIKTLSYDGTAWLNVSLDHIGDNNGTSGTLPATVLYEPAA